MLRSALLKRAVAARTGLRSISSAEAELAFRRFGHMEATLDPLGLKVRPPRVELQEAAAGLPAADLARLRATYCGPLGAEVEHCDSAAERAWWADKLATLVPEGAPGSFELSAAAKRNANVLLQQAEAFELFLGRKFVSFKRYSGEGTESLMPALDAIFANAAGSGVEDVVIGMAHRGRLALLVSLLNYPARKLFHKISAFNDIPEAVQGIDDVSSHVASSVDRTYGVGDRARKVHVSLLHNPSHLEAVNPVAVGKARAKMAGGSSDALCLLVHGDAAVSGQGVVAETYAMANLPGYTVGGTIHLITNNQLGFTADEGTARSSNYASDMAKVIGAPVLHVNAESLREVLLACKLAVEYRATFKKDVVIDMIGYRRHGHNELDPAEFTQPGMYKCIKGRPSFPATYASQLEKEGLLAPGGRQAIIDKVNAHLEAEFNAAKAFTAETGSQGLGSGPATAGAAGGSHVVADGTAFAGKWASMRQARPEEMFTSPDTGVDAATLQRVGMASVAIPAGFQPHDRLMRSHVAPRIAALGGAGAAAGWSTASREIDWATAEALAFGSLLDQGYGVRMSGQDAQRGTFSHRHLAFTDQTSGKKTFPLTDAMAAKPGAGKLDIVSSFLSEFAVMGFEFGFSWESPSNMVVWEAQFGDFANGAQIIIDNFLTGTETKWLRQSGLTLLLPHGYDGAGPEHSSARIERFLQLVNSQGVARGASCLESFAGKDKSVHEAINMVVANPTTPANYFHLLRRQMVRPFRKPLVVVAPKQLLRHPQAVSSLNEMAPGTTFQPVLDDALLDASVTPKDVKRVVLVSGKFYYELAKRRADVGNKDTVMLRVEELAPFPAEVLVSKMKAFPGLKSVAWVQEEPANAGAWTWAEAHLAPAMAAAGLPGVTYLGRPALATPAVGLSKFNKLQQDAIINTCFA